MCVVVLLHCYMVFYVITQSNVSFKWSRFLLKTSFYTSSTHLYLSHGSIKRTRQNHVHITLAQYIHTVQWHTMQPLFYNIFALISFVILCIILEFMNIEWEHRRNKIFFVILGKIIVEHCISVGVFTFCVCVWMCWCMEIVPVRYMYNNNEGWVSCVSTVMINVVIHGRCMMCLNHFNSTSKVYNGETLNKNWIYLC